MKKKQIKIYLRLDPDEETGKHFSQIKRRLGLKNNTEVLRATINSYWFSLGVGARELARRIEALSKRVEALEKK